MFDGLATAVLAVALVGSLVWGAWRGRASSKKEFHFTVGQHMPMRDIVIYKLGTKEIVTEKNHIWGNVGRSYLSWLVSEKKAIIVFDLDIEFRYDLTKAKVSPSENAVRIELPPCHQEVLVRRVQLYDERGGELLSWLLPGVIAKMIGGYTPDQRNALMAEAQKTAEELAAAQALRLGDEVQKSAVAMLTFMASGGGSRKVSVQFDLSANHRLITVAPDVLALPSAA